MQDERLTPFVECVNDAIDDAMRELARKGRAVYDVPHVLKMLSDGRVAAKYLGSWTIATKLMSMRHSAYCLELLARRACFAHLAQQLVDEYMATPCLGRAYVQRPTLEITHSFGIVEYGIWGYAYMYVPGSEQKEIDDCKEE